MRDLTRANTRWLLVLGAVVVPGALYAWWHLRSSASQFVTESVTEGAVVRSVATTGAVNPVVTVQVGSYVSGVIQVLYCDYNTEVKAGQLCAKIDPRSDVGATKVGQKASFTVESYQGKVFWGQVTQLRQAPITVQNVVTYDVVVSVDNPELVLLPGMTANTRIITDERENVLRVPVTALRFLPSGRNQMNGPGASGAEKPGGKRAAARVWVLRDGQPQPVPVTAGLSDGILGATMVRVARRNFAGAARLAGLRLAAVTAWRDRVLGV